jgi:rubrerythrin
MHSVFKSALLQQYSEDISDYKQDNGKKLTHEQLVRSVRSMVSAEYEAIQLYEKLADSTDNQRAQSVLRDIAGEEKVHAGEFLKLLEELDPSEVGYYEKGFEE